MKKLYKYEQSFGRMGHLSGVFLLDKETFDKGMGHEVYMGEILGKHSEVVALINKNTLKELTDDQDFIDKCIKYKIVPNGTNPFDYIPTDIVD